MTEIWAIVVGAGSGRRFAAELPKQYHLLHGEPLFRRSLKAFIDHPKIDGVLPVIAAEAAECFAELCGDLSTMAPVHGGATRQVSVARALEALAPHRPDAVLIHDAARPLVGPEIIDRVLEALGTYRAVVPAIPVRDTLKRQEDGRIIATVDRTPLVAVQTPQGFEFTLLRAAHARAAANDASDDAGLVEALGETVHLVTGHSRNLKITDPEDLGVAHKLTATSGVPKVGIGYDVHRLVDGEGVMLGGVLIPAPFRLLGHSDADVALHAVTDAILGALGDGDIGTLFPPSDAQWKDADSAIFLEEACRRVTQRGAAIAHLDLTIICEQPKIGPYRPAICARIAEICGLTPETVSVKATTTERLGFTGRGEGIAAQAAATILCPV